MSYKAFGAEWPEEDCTGNTPPGECLGWLVGEDHIEACNDCGPKAGIHIDSQGRQWGVVDDEAAKFAAMAWISAALPLVRVVADLTHTEDADGTRLPPVAGSGLTDLQWVDLINRARGLTLRVGDGGPE